MFGGFNSAGLFNNSSECSTHLFRRFRISVIVLPFLFPTDRSGLLHFSDSLLVVSNSPLTFPSLTDFSAAVTRSSTYFRLPPLMTFFIRLFPNVYSARVLDFSALISPSQH